MKLNAVTGNGTMLKDFVDIAYLSSFLTLEDMVTAYQTKYNTRNPYISLKALSYHHEINFNEPLPLTNGPYKWKTIEGRLNQMLKSPGKIFPALV